MVLRLTAQASMVTLPSFMLLGPDNVRFAILLLDYNVDLNATNINHQTPLTTAIMYNSHQVLELFLVHWEEFSTCPRLKGPNLLEITAL